MQTIQTFFSATHLQQIAQIKEVYSLLTQLEDETNTDSRVRYVAANVKLYHRMRDIDDILTKEFKKANKITDKKEARIRKNYAEQENEMYNLYYYWLESNCEYLDEYVKTELGESKEMGFFGRSNGWYALCKWDDIDYLDAIADFLVMVDKINPNDADDIEEFETEIEDLIYQLPTIAELKKYIHVLERIAEMKKSLDFGDEIRFRIEIGEL